MSGASQAPDIRLLADDLTGALDSAAAFAGSVPVYLGAAPAMQVAGVVAVATPTRDVPVEDLPQSLDRVRDWFCGGAIAFKKVDSLLRGNTFAECSHLARAGGFDGIVFAPAFPAQRRLTVGGRQVVRSADGVDEAVGPPMAEGFAALGHDVDTPSAMSRRPAPSVVWIPEASTDDDLRRIARRAVPGPQALPGRWLWCGSAGLARAIAEAFDAAAGPGTPPEADPCSGGAAERVLMFGASHHAAVRAQWRRLRHAWPAALQVVAGDEAQFAAACAAMRGPYGLAALELSPLHRLTPKEAAALLERQLAALVESIVPPSLLLVVGGDTLLATCRATGAHLLQTVPARRPGWGCARIVGGHWDGVVCHARSGAFGDEDDLDGMLRCVGAPAGPSGTRFA